MPQSKLGSQSIAEIRSAVRDSLGLSHLPQTIRELAERYGVSTDRIYALTADIRPRRRPRRDRGKTKYNLLEHDALRVIAAWIVEYDITPEEAIRLARQRGYDVPVEFPTLRRYLRQAGLDRRSSRIPVAHRRFEASAPGEIFQFDISGLKQRWMDATTRKLISVSTLDVSDNHPNANPSRVRVWRFALVDDYSRMAFVRYVAVEKPSGSHVTDFLLQAYATLGVPLKLYTDNDGVIKFGRNARTTQLLSRLLETQGGYEHICHLPGNAKATGKVERLHQTIERYERVIGLFIAERGVVTIDDLNQDFAPNLCKYINERTHSETGQRPVDRWHSRRTLVRRLDYDSLRSVFMADEFELRLHSDLTLRYRGRRLQLPGSDAFPFAAWIGQKLRVVIPDGQPFFTVIGLDGNEYDIKLSEATADVAGSFKTFAESGPARLRKQLRAEAREAAKLQRKSHLPVRHFDSEPQSEPPQKITHFPQPEIVISAETAIGQIDAVQHEPAITYWEAVAKYSDQFKSKAEAKQFFGSLFESRDADSWLLISEIESALANRFNEERRLKAV